MKKEQIMGAIRHALTFIGGLVVANGYLSESESVELIGSVVGLVGLVWSYIAKK